MRVNSRRRWLEPLKSRLIQNLELFHIAFLDTKNLVFRDQFGMVLRMKIDLSLFDRELEIVDSDLAKIDFAASLYFHRPRFVLRLHYGRRIWVSCAESTSVKLESDFSMLGFVLRL